MKTKIYDRAARAMIAAPLAPTRISPITSIQPVTPQSTISGRANIWSTKVATRSAPSYQAIDHTPAPEPTASAPVFQRDARTGRPTKRDRRDLERLRRGADDQY